MLIIQILFVVLGITLLVPIEGLASDEVESSGNMQQLTAIKAVDIDLKKAEQDLQQAIAKLKLEIDAAKATNMPASKDQTVGLPVAKENTQPLPVATYQTKKEEPANREITVDQVGNYIDQIITVTMIAGNQRTGRLTKVDGGQLWFEHKAYAGTLTYKLLANDIKSIEINN